MIIFAPTNTLYQPMESIAQDVANTISIFEKRLGMAVSIYDFSGSLTSHLPPDKMTHRNPYCLALIQVDSGLKCGHFDCFVSVPRTLQREKSGFFKRCHGNVLEYVHGLWRDGELLGAILAGQFQWPESTALPGVVLTAKSRTRTNSNLSSLYRELRTISPEEIESLPVFISSLAAQLMSLIPYSSAVRRGDQKRRWLIDDFLTRRFRFVETRLSDLAKLLGLSEDRARHVVTELYEKSFIDLLTEKRVKHAKVLLSSTNITVTQMAEYCGYADSHHFHRIFRKAVGLTPLEYRRQSLQPTTS